MGLETEVARRVLDSLVPERAEVRVVYARDRSAGLEATARLAGEAVRRYASGLEEAARGHPLSALKLAIDKKLRTERPEHMDLDATPEPVRLQIIEGLALWNRLVRAYPTFVRAVAPLVEAAAAAGRRPARVLELASGHGELLAHVAEWAAGHGIEVELTGSDIVPAYVKLGEEKARARGAPVRYRVLDALDLGDVEDGAFDVVLLTQTLHHFAPGQVARLFAEGSRVARTGALFLDPARSVAVLAFVGAVTRAFFSRPMHEDAVTSMRKVRTDAEYELLAGVAPLAGRAQVRFVLPGYTAVEVRR